MSPETAGRDLCNRGLQLALAVTLGLALETLRGSALPPLAPVIALQLLAASPAPPPLRMVGLLVLAAAAASALAYLVAAATLEVPGLYTVGIALLYLWSFALTFTPGLGPVGVMAVTMTVVVTATAAASTGLALGIAVEIVLSIGAGILLVYLAHVAFPAGPQTKPQGAAPAPAAALDVPARAVLATVVMVPLHLYMTSEGVAAMVVLLTTATMLRQPGIAQSTRYCLAFAAGNALGAVLALVSNLLLAVHDNAALTVAVVGTTALLLAGRVVASPGAAPVYLPGFVTYTMLFGLTLSPLPIPDGVEPLARVLQIVAAAAYTFCAVSLLLQPLRRLNRHRAAGPA